MTRSWWWVVLALACRPASTTTEGETTTAPEHGAARRRALDEFLRVDVDLAARFPLRARIVRAGAIYPEHDGKQEGDPGGRTVSIEVTVLDPDAHGDPLRPRVLCAHADHRIAVHIDVADLATVAREGAVMTATPQNGTGWSGRQPGVRVRAGTALRIEGEQDAAHVRANIEQPWLRVVGFLPRSYVGRTWVPEATEAPPDRADTRVREPSPLLATLGGLELGRIDPRMRAEGVFVRRLGAEQGGFTLVRHDDAQTTTVGWIATTALEPGVAVPGGGRILGGRTQVDIAAPIVELARGTLLRGGALRNPIGVVTQTARFHCLADCDDALPRVEVDACTTVLGVWAERAR